MPTTRRSAFRAPEGSWAPKQPYGSLSQRCVRAIKNCAQKFAVVKLREGVADRQCDRQVSERRRRRGKQKGGPQALGKKPRLALPPPILGAAHRTTPAMTSSLPPVCI